MHFNFFARSCQRAVLLAAAATLVVFLLIPAQGQIISTSTGVAHLELTDFLHRFSNMHVEGSGSFNWRAVGPKYPEYETQIQNEVYLADMYFGLGGPVAQGVPFFVEWNMPTSSQGEIRLNQLNFEYDRFDDYKFQIGKFVVPFGRYNELYRPDEFLTVTRPLLFSSPDSLDLVIRLNSPRPPLTVGYTDIGLRASYYPESGSPYLPDEITFFVVNGLGEENNRLRTFPNTDNLGVPPVPGNGTEIDFGHQDNNLADNNNNKVPGARVVYSLGEVRFPWPIPEGRALELNGVNLGFSAMGGEYDLEGSLNYQMYDADLTFDYLGFNFTSEYVYSLNEFLAPLGSSLAPAGGTSSSPNVQMTQDFEINQGYFVQASYPLIKKPRWGKRVTGVVVFNQMFRRGPALDLYFNQYANGVLYPSLDAIDPAGPRATTQMDKYTGALNYQLSEHFWLKTEFSYWVLSRASEGNVFGTAPATSLLGNSLGRLNVYQTAISLVMGF